MSASGTSNTSLVGAALDAGVLSAAGASSASLVGAALAAASFASDGTSSASIVGAALDAGTLSAPADSSAMFVGNTLAAGILGAPGDSSTALSGAELAGGLWSAQGDSSATFQARADSVFTAAGDSSAAFVGESAVYSRSGGGGAGWIIDLSRDQGRLTSPPSGAFAATGESGASWIGRATVAAELSATTDSTFDFHARSLAQGAFTMAAASTSQYTGEELYDNEEIDRRVAARTQENDRIREEAESALLLVASSLAVHFPATGSRRGGTR